MKNIFYIGLLFVALVNIVFCVLTDSVVSGQWKKFRTTAGKKYGSINEETKRMNIFRTNLEKIEKHNEETEKGLYTYTLGLSPLADLTVDELKVRLGFRVNAALRNVSRKTFIASQKVKELPESVDWREKRVVTEVKDQGECGSCYAFSATGAFEGQRALLTKRLVALSEQQIVDCSNNHDNMGCEGGLMDSSFQYVIDAGGIQTAKTYPYHTLNPKQGRCVAKSRSFVLKCTGFVDIESGNEEALKEAVATIGPISVAIDVQDDFMLYQSGVYKDTKCKSDMISLNHAVLVVGYGTDPKLGDYWIVKNSWSEKWGDKGYIKMARNCDNLCGIATFASYPLVSR